MTKLSHSAAAVGLQESVPAFHRESSTFDWETSARKSLNLLGCSKVWADALHVSPQQVNGWKGGERIPEVRQRQIVHQALMFMIQLDELEDEIHRLIFDELSKGRG